MLTINGKTYLTDADLASLAAVRADANAEDRVKAAKDIADIAEALPRVEMSRSGRAIYDGDDFATWFRATTAKARAEFHQPLAEMNADVEFVPKPPETALAQPA